MVDVEGDLAEVQPDGSLIYQFDPETENPWDPWIPHSMTMFYAPYTVQVPAPVLAKDVV